MNRSCYPTADAARGAVDTATGIRTPALIPLTMRAEPVPAGHYRLDDEVVYFIQAGEAGPIKIGYCSSEAGVFSRLASLQTGSPDKLRLRRLVAGGRGLESEYHLRFAGARMEGEWFLNTLEVAKEANAPDMKHRDPHRRLLPLLEKSFEAGERAGYAKCQLTMERAIRHDLERLVKEWDPDPEASVDDRLASAYYKLAQLKKQAEDATHNREPA